MRSTACVDAIKRVFGKSIKVGHGGTLDSTAEGVLVVLLGGATRLSSFVMAMRKTYEADIQLGRETDTCDSAGETVMSGEIPDPTAIDRSIDDMLIGLLGMRAQIPPMVSAVHVNGRRAHELFRSGEAPKIDPRIVMIYKIDKKSDVSPDGLFTIEVVCGKGTYIRSIARDIGRTLGCGAHIARLRRKKVGIFSVDDAIDGSRDDFSELVKNGVKPMSEISALLPAYRANGDSARFLMRGQAVPMSDLELETFGYHPPAETIAIMYGEGMTIAKLTKTNGLWAAQPEINLKER